MIVLRLQLLLLAFVRSIRDADFELYTATLAQIIPWCFAMNRTNYARWLPERLRDMLALSSTCPEVRQEFVNGNFVVHKSQNLFSAIAIDHAHEQNNGMLKGDGGVIGLLQNSDTVLRWLIAGSEIKRLILEFEET